MAVKKTTKIKLPPQSVECVNTEVRFLNPITHPTPEHVLTLKAQLSGFDGTIEPHQTDEGVGFRLKFASAKHARASFGRMFTADSANKKDANEAALGKVVEALVTTRADWNDDVGMTELAEKVVKG